MSKETLRKQFEQETGREVKITTLFGDVKSDEWEYNPDYVSWLEKKILNQKQR